MALGGAGCNSAAPDPEDGPPKPKVVAFDGAVDSTFVGDWQTAKGSSGLDLRPDGTVTISSSNPTPGGIQNLKLEGKWLVSQGNLLLQYSTKNQPQTTVRYPASLVGDKLTLQQGGRTKSVYTKKSGTARGKTDKKN